VGAALDVGAVRPAEQLDWTRVAAYLRDHLQAGEIDGLDLARDMVVEQFHGGHSNLTYLIRFGDAELVLRRAPLGPLPPTAHDMVREYRWLTAVHPVFPAAPRPYVLCEDVKVAGAPFYVMERRHGVIIRNEEPPALAGHAAERRRVSAGVVDTLARLHRLDLQASGLSHLGKPMGFVERQVRGWSDRWQRSRLDEVPEMDQLVKWLPEHLPPNPERPGVVHGDFKLDNLMLDPDDLGRVVGVFDWEMSALGDPLVDVGILLTYWLHASRLSGHDALNTVTDQPGWFTREELLERYAAASGRDVSRLAFYETFALFKVAVVIQQIYYRYRVGQTDDARFANFGERVTHLARQAAKAAG
jgi:aminoglycoside phosphotransferase (APT) family kinase protein